MALPIPKPAQHAWPTDPEAQARQEREDRRIIWVFLWTLFCFKLGTVLIIAWMAGASGEAKLILTATGWPFLIIPVLAIAGPLLYHYRVRRVRAKREQLLRSEWMIE
jgi:hypothetical protein